MLPTLHSRSRRAACARACAGSRRHSSREGSASRESSSSKEERDEGEGVAAATRMREKGEDEGRRGRSRWAGRLAWDRPVVPRRPVEVAAAWEAVRKGAEASMDIEGVTVGGALSQFTTLFSHVQAHGGGVPGSLRAHAQPDAAGGELPACESAASAG